MGDGEKTRRNGWFSRRHETSEAHDRAVGWWKENKGRAGRQKRAKERETRKER